MYGTSRGTGHRARRRGSFADPSQKSPIALVLSHLTFGIHVGVASTSSLPTFPRWPVCLFPSCARDVYRAASANLHREGFPPHILVLGTAGNGWVPQEGGTYSTVLLYSGSLPPTTTHTFASRGELVLVSLWQTGTLLGRVYADPPLVRSPSTTHPITAARLSNIPDQPLPVHCYAATLPPLPRSRKPAHNPTRLRLSCRRHVTMGARSVSLRN